MRGNIEKTFHPRATLSIDFQNFLQDHLHCVPTDHERTEPLFEGLQPDATLETDLGVSRGHDEDQVDAEPTLLDDESTNAVDCGRYATLAQPRWEPNA